MKKSDKGTEGVRSHIILEAFCLRKTNPRKGKYCYELNSETKKFKKVRNPKYDPDYRTPKKPRYCPDVPSYPCLEKGCPHLGYTNAHEKDYEILFKQYKK